MSCQAQRHTTLSKQSASHMHWLLLFKATDSWSIISCQTCKSCKDCWPFPSFSGHSRNTQLSCEWRHSSSLSVSFSLGQWQSRNVCGTIKVSFNFPVAIPAYCTSPYLGLAEACCNWSYMCGTYTAWPEESSYVYRKYSCMGTHCAWII